MEGTDSTPDTNYRTFPKETVPGDSTDGSANRIRPSTRWITVEPAIIIYNVAFNAATPLQIQYVNYRIGQDLGVNTSHGATFWTTSDPNSCDVTDDQHAAVQRQAATYLTLMTMSSIVPSLITTLLIGAYSDKAGRKYGLISPLIGEIIRVFISVLITAFRLPLEIFYVALFFQGLVGGAASFLMTCFSYMADVTSPSNRGFRIFVVELCNGFGQILAQVAIGEAIAKFGYMYPFIFIFFLQAFTLLYIIFVLPETLYRLPNTTLLSFEHYKASFRLYFGDAMYGKRLTLGLGLAVLAVSSAVNMVNMETITLFLVNRPFCWDSIMVGYYSAVALAVKYFCSLLLLKLLARRLPEAVLAMGSLVSSCAYDVVVGLATQSWVLFLAPLAGIGAQLADPMIKTIMSKLVNRENQGALFASHAWMSMISAMIGTVFFNAIYGMSVNYTGLVFLIAALLYAVPFGLTLLLHFREKRTRLEDTRQLFSPNQHPMSEAEETTDSNSLHES